jgi:pre-mRNA-processing factor 19
MSLFVCEISGESSSSTGMVVTPSGHVCRRSLLLQKLSENGGVDPFEQPPRPLSEDELIDLRPSLSGSGDIIPPRIASATSMSSLLELVQKEYNAVLLELFDTKRALEETRQELSQTLYQNDAATRVVARLAMERDAARQQLEQLSSGVISSSNGAPARSQQLVAGGEATSATASAPGSAAEVEPPLKKAKMDDDAKELVLPLWNDIPEADLALMIATWEDLHKGRKQMLKDRTSSAPSPEDLANYSAPPTTASYHKTKCKGIVALAASDKLLASAGMDKSVVIYDAEKQTVVQSIAASGRQAVTALDVNSSVVLVGQEGGTVTVYSLDDGAAMGSVQPPESVAARVAKKGGTMSLASVHLHPDGAHGLIAYQSGHLTLFSLETFVVLSVFDGGDGDGPDGAGYTCGALHPDGLIYVCGTSKGNLALCDLKSRSLATTLPGSEGQGPVTSVEISENGYHIAAAHSSSSAVALWNLRKQKQIGTVAGPCEALAFDDSGKYLAVGGATSLRIVNVKDQVQVAALHVERDISGLCWNLNKLAVVSGKVRDISFFG